MGIHVVFEDREEAGRALAKRLELFHASDALILAIPKGGVPIAAITAHRLQLEWNVIVTRKLPVPWNPESSFGAITADGCMVVNEPMIHGLQLSSIQIEATAAEIRQVAIRRTEFYASEKKSSDIAGRNVIVVDDGLASGYTMLAAIKCIRDHSPSRVIAASPVASRYASKMIGEAADECVFITVSPSVPFSVADFYLSWPDLTDDELRAYMHKE